jgi:hypothetical protein
MSFNKYEGLIRGGSGWVPFKEGSVNCTKPTSSNNERIGTAIQLLATENAKLEEQLAEYRRQAKANAKAKEEAQSSYKALFIRNSQLEEEISQYQRQAMIDEDVKILLSASLEMYEKNSSDSRELELANQELIYLLGHYQEYILHLRANIENFEDREKLVSSANIEFKEKISLLEQVCSEYFAILIEAKILNDEFLKNFNADLSRSGVEKHLLTTRKIIEFFQQKTAAQPSVKVQPSFIHPLVVIGPQSKPLEAQTTNPHILTNFNLSFQPTTPTLMAQNSRQDQKRIQLLQQFPQKMNGEEEKVHYDTIGIPRNWQSLNCNLGFN